MKTLVKVSISIFFIIGCTHQEIIKDTPSAKHHQKSTELQSIMHKFENLIYQNFQSELDRDMKRMNYTQDIIVLIDDLILNSQKLQTLPTQQSKGFLTLAKALEKQSKELKKIVLNYQIEKIAPSLNAINNTCTQCHANLQ
ncbi:MAG: Unknown protein [uncultured Sulfurovum sp.]|uniref:Cytochrome C n=1 Tax=uncultured Sulfurovum sp. TaxID=269237 RepID=A0A6S6TKU4_9BACT|nr:MAG: Unknown protein [uncultured Sulfurovum sp.]